MMKSGAFDYVLYNLCKKRNQRPKENIKTSATSNQK